MVGGREGEGRGGRGLTDVREVRDKGRLREGWEGGERDEDDVVNVLLQINS